MTVLEMLKKVKKLNKINEELGLPKQKVYLEYVNIEWSITHYDIDKINKWIEKATLEEVRNDFYNHKFKDREEFTLTHTWGDEVVSNDTYKISLWKD